MQELSDEDLSPLTAGYRERFDAGESLDDQLPEAFATVREGSVTIDGHHPGPVSKSIVSYLPDADFLNPDWNARTAVKEYSRFFAPQNYVHSNLLLYIHTVPHTVLTVPPRDRS